MKASDAAYFAAGVLVTAVIPIVGVTAAVRSGQDYPKAPGGSPVGAFIVLWMVSLVWPVVITVIGSALRASEVEDASRKAAGIPPFWSLPSAAKLFFWISLPAAPFGYLLGSIALASG